MKTFIQNLEEELRKNNLKEDEIQDIIADHTEMIESAIKEGLSDADLEVKFGNPKDLADELSQFTEKDAKEKNKLEVMEFNDVEADYSIEITLVNEDLEFVFNDENKIIVEYVGRKSLSSYHVTFQNNTFVLKSPRNTISGLNFFGRDDNRSFKLSIPNGLDIDSFKLKEVNGDVSLQNITAKELVFETTNGDLELQDLTLGTFKTGTVNGDMKITNITCVEYSASMISGDVRIDGLKCEKDVRVNTVSGDISIKNSSCNDASLKTVSGDLVGKEFYPKTLSLASVSGDISIENKDSGKPIEVKHRRSVSGDVKIITK